MSIVQKHASKLIRNYSNNFYVAITDTDHKLLETNDLFDQHFPGFLIGEDFNRLTSHKVLSSNSFREDDFRVGLDKASSKTLLYSDKLGDIWVQWYDQKITVGPDIYIVKLGINVSQYENLLHQYIETSSFAKAGYWRMDLKNQTLFWSEEVFKIHGVNPKFYQPNLETAIDFYFEEDAKIIANLVKNCIENQIPFRKKLRIKRPDKQLVYIETFGECELDTRGEVVAITGTFRDRSFEAYSETNVKSKQKRLDETLFINQQLRSTLDEHALVSTADVKGNITLANNKFCDVSGYSFDELITKNHRILKSDEHDDAFYKDMWDTISSGKAWQGEICNRSKSGEKYWVNSTIVPFLNKQTNKPDQYVSIRTQITEQKRMQSKMNDLYVEAMAASEAKSRLISNVSHELLTPLNHILGFSSLVQSSDSIDEIKEYVSHVDAAGNDLLKKVKNILKILEEDEAPEKTDNHFQNHQFSELDIWKEFQIRANKEGKRFSLKLDASDALLDINQIDLVKVVSEVVDNAFKYASPNGSIEVNSQIKGQSFTLNIIDDGKGFAEDLITFGVEHFSIGEITRNKSASGLGLGLALCKKILSQYDGNLMVENTDKGGHVTIQLFLAESMQQKVDNVAYL